MLLRPLPRLLRQAGLFADDSAPGGKKWPRKDGLIIDEFACGGGMSEAIRRATQREVFAAVNHDEDAMSMHEVNHPRTHHFINDVFKVDPIVVTEGMHVDLLHASPDCTDHSQAKGGQPRSRQRRALAWIAVRWAGQKRPRAITLENVARVTAWNRLIAKRDAATGRVIKIDGMVAAKGEHVPVQQQYLVPDPRTEGKTWRRFVAVLRSMGYAVDWRVLCAADYGAPTSRRRLFMIARCDGLPITWPKPTHFKNPLPGQKKWRGAHECIDWSIPCKTIFDRKKPMVDASLRRVAKGMFDFVINHKDPFIVPLEMRGPPPPQLDGPAQSRLAAFMEQANGGFNKTWGRDLREPTTTTTTSGSQQRLVMAHLVHLRRNCHARDLRDPLHTISAGGQHHGLVEYTLAKEDETNALRCAAFLMRYYGQGGQWSDLRDPSPTITTKARLALVTVWYRGEAYVIVDICMRMLSPRELYRANGFPDHYIIDRGHDGRVFTKEKQISFCGNAVPPPLGEAVIREVWQSFEYLEAA